MAKGNALGIVIMLKIYPQSAFKTHSVFGQIKYDIRSDLCINIILPQNTWRQMRFTDNVRCNLYQVSSYGDVINMNTGDIIKPYISSNGHCYILLERNDSSKRLYLQENITAYTFIDIPDILINEDIIVRHKNGICYDNYESNLAYEKFIEEWKPLIVDGCCTDYFISNKGNIMSHKYGKQTIIKRQKGPNNSVQVRLRLNDAYKNIKIHRYVAKYYVQNPNNENVVNHINGDRSNPFYLNLEWVSPSENTQHAMLTGLHSNFLSGTDNPANVYTEEQIHAVCKLLMEGKTIPEVVNIMHVSQSLVKAILYRNGWIHISSQYDLKNRRRKMTKAST